MKKSRLVSLSPVVFRPEALHVLVFSHLKKHWWYDFVVKGRTQTGTEWLQFENPVPPLSSCIASVATSVKWRE